MESEQTKSIKGAIEIMKSSGVINTQNTVFEKLLSISQQQDKSGGVGETESKSIILDGVLEAKEEVCSRLIRDEYVKGKFLAMGCFEGVYLKAIDEMVLQSLESMLEILYEDKNLKHTTQEKQMKQIEFKDLQKGMEILVDGELYGRAVYEVFEKEYGICVITKGEGRLMALTEMAIESGAVKVYAVTSKESLSKEDVVAKALGLPSQKARNIFSEAHAEWEVEQSSKLFMRVLSGSSVVDYLKTTAAPTPCNCSGCCDGVDEDEEIDITLTRKQIEKVASVLAFVEDEDIFEVMSELDPYIDDEVLDEDMESVVITVDSSLPMFDEPIYMMPNFFNLKFEQE